MSTRSVKDWRQLPIADSLRTLRMHAWRCVESQYIPATMKLVDTPDEQKLLEDLLESSKPPLPSTAKGKHFLLYTPLRYRPRQDSRFRKVGSTGIWYGAASIKTALCEVAYWRRQFVNDNAATSQQVLKGRIITTDHSVFAAEVKGKCLDLTSEPWLKWRELWRADSYAATHAVADAANTAGASWIRYESARIEAQKDKSHLCAATFNLDALNPIKGKPIESTIINWRCLVKADSVTFVRDLLGKQEIEVFDA